MSLSRRNSRSGTHSGGREGQPPPRCLPSAAVKPKASDPAARLNVPHSALPGAPSGGPRNAALGSSPPSSLPGAPPMYPQAGPWVFQRPAPPCASPADSSSVLSSGQSCSDGKQSRQEKGPQHQALHQPRWAGGQRRARRDRARTMSWKNSRTVASHVTHVQLVAVRGAWNKTTTARPEGFPGECRNMKKT